MSGSFTDYNEPVRVCGGHAKTRFHRGGAVLLLLHL